MDHYKVGDRLVKRNRTEREMDVRYEITGHLAESNYYLVSNMNKSKKEEDVMMTSKQIYEKFILVNIEWK